MCSFCAFLLIFFLHIRLSCFRFVLLFTCLCAQGLEEQRKDPVTGNDMVQGLLERVRELCREQERRRGELEANYKESFTRATQENWTGASFVGVLRGVRRRV